MAASDSSSIPDPWQAMLSEYRNLREEIALGGGKKGIDRQHEKGRLTARERIAKLIDEGTSFLELG